VARAPLTNQFPSESKSSQAKSRTEDGKWGPSGSAAAGNAARGEGQAGRADGSSSQQRDQRANQQPASTPTSDQVGAPSAASQSAATHWLQSSASAAPSVSLTQRARSQTSASQSLAPIEQQHQHQQRQTPMGASSAGSVLHIVLGVISALMGAVLLAFLLICVVIYQIKPNSSSMLNSQAANSGTLMSLANSSAAPMKGLQQTTMSGQHVVPITSANSQLETNCQFFPRQPLGFLLPAGQPGQLVGTPAETPQQSLMISLQAAPPIQLTNNSPPSSLTATSSNFGTESACSNSGMLSSLTESEANQHPMIHAIHARRQQQQQTQFATTTGPLSLSQSNNKLPAVVHCDPQTGSGARLVPVANFVPNSIDENINLSGRLVSHQFSDQPRVSNDDWTNLSSYHPMQLMTNSIGRTKAKNPQIFSSSLGRPRQNTNQPDNSEVVL